MKSNQTNLNNVVIIKLMETTPHKASNVCVRNFMIFYNGENVSHMFKSLTASGKLLKNGSINIHNYKQIAINSIKEIAKTKLIISHFMVIDEH